MMYKIYNIYFIVSLTFFAVLFIKGLFDIGRNYIDNSFYLISLLLSLINMIFVVYLGSKQPK